MICFKGELSDKNKCFLANLDRHGSLVAACIIAIIVAIPITLLTLLDDAIFALAYILLPAIIIVFSFPLPKNKWDLISPQCVTISNDSLISYGKGFNHVRMECDVKSVIDYEDMYLILFYFPHKSLVFACQKNLIVEGTIAEFEERFADYIVRKTNK